MIKISIETKRLEEIEVLSSQQLDNLFTKEELSCSNKTTLTGKLAAKTAFFRNAGLSCFTEDYKKVEVGKKSSGRPFLNLLDTSLSEKVSGFKTAISISHTKDTAVAICILYK
jgi:phosphopantetheine--protein transferase-like protein